MDSNLKVLNIENAILENDQDIPTREYTEEERTGFYNTANVSVNTATGERMVLGTDPEEYEYVTEELSDLITSDFSIELDDETIQKTMATNDFGMNFEDMAMFMDVIKEYKANDGKVSNLFNRLPESMRTQINNVVSQSAPVGSNANIKGAKNMVAKEIVNNFINDAEMNQIQVDLDKEIDKMVGDFSKEIAEIHQGSIYDKIEKLEHIAENESKDEESKNHILSIVDALKESFEMEIFKENIKYVKVKKFDIEKPNKVYDSFKFKYKDSKFTIQDPANLPVIIANHTDCLFVEALDLVLAFCKYCKNYNPSNIAQHTFMYYFIANIISLNITSPHKEYDEFSQKIVDNLKECIELRKNKQD